MTGERYCSIMRDYSKDWPLVSGEGAVGGGESAFRKRLIEREEERYAVTRQRLDGEAAHIIHDLRRGSRRPKGLPFGS